MGKKVSLILFLFIFLVKVPSLKAFTILGNQGDFNYFPEKLPSLNPSKILAQVSGELDPGINYATATWQELVESSYPLTRALGLALCNDAKFLQDYAHKLNLIELATYGFFELFALINNPLFHSPGTPRSEETKMTKFQEMVANGSIKVAINLMEEQRQGLDLESIAEQLPKNGDLRKALAKSVFLQTEAKKEIIIQMLPFFDNPQIDVNKRAQIGATFSVLNLINDARIGLSYFREVQLRNWLQKFLDSKEDGGVRQGAGTLLAYALRQQRGSEGIVRINPAEIALKTWEEVLKKEKNIYLWEISGEIISAVMDDVLHTTEVFKDSLLAEIYNWYNQEESLQVDYKVFILYSLLGGMADPRVASDLKLKFLPLFQEISFQGYSSIGQAGIMQIVSDPKIPLTKKEELAQIGLKKLADYQNSGKSLNQLLKEKKIERFDLALLGLVAGQSLYLKAQVTNLLTGLGVSKEILDFWKDYTVFVAGKERDFTPWELERMREVFNGLPEEWRKTVGVIISSPERRRTFGRSGEFSRVLANTFQSGGIVIYGEIRELLKEKGKEEADKWFARVVFHEIAHTRHFFGFTIEQLQAFQFYWESVRNNPQRVARDYGLQNLWEYVATLFEDYALDSLGFMAEAKKDAFLLEAFKTVVDTLKYQVKDKWKVRIYRIEGDGKLSWREVDIDKDGLPIIPSDWE